MQQVFIEIFALEARNWNIEKIGIDACAGRVVPELTVIDAGVCSQIVAQRLTKLCTNGLPLVIDSTITIPLL